MPRVTFAEPMAGAVEEIEGSRFLEFAGVQTGTFRISPLEAHLAENFHAYTLP